MALFTSILTVLIFIFLGRAMFDLGIAFGYAIGPKTELGYTVDFGPSIQYLAQSRILIWLGLFVSVALIRPCLSIFTHHDPEIYEAENQGRAGLVENAGGILPFGLQVIGAILCLILGLKWWTVISPSESLILQTFSTFDWGCLIMASILLTLPPFLPKVRKNDS